MNGYTEIDEILDSIFDVHPNYDEKCLSFGDPDYPSKYVDGRIVFEDLDNFSAAVTFEGDKDNKPGYRIYDSKDNYVAVLNSYGGGFTNGNRDEKGDRIIYRTYFDSRTQLKQAVRYAYLFLQQQNC